MRKVLLAVARRGLLQYGNAGDGGSTQSHAGIGRLCRLLRRRRRTRATVSVPVGHPRDRGRGRVLRQGQRRRGQGRRHRRRRRFHHPDLAGAIDVGLSCSFIFDHDPTALPVEEGNGDCSNKAAVQDMQGHGTHVATTIAGRVNGVGIAGVAPGATIVALKACTVLGYCFADSVVAALRYAGDQHLDVVNLSLFADPYLFYCKNEAEQRTILKTLSSATRYAQRRGVVVVASAGNELTDLSHPVTDELSPDWPPDAPVTRDVGNQCQVAPSELPGVVTVAATGVTTLAGYSNTGHTVNVAAPGGDAVQTPGVTFGRILAVGQAPTQAARGRAFPGSAAAVEGADGAALGVDQWHVDGVAACGRRRRTHP